jgi:hypothetical protein
VFFIFCFRKCVCLHVGLSSTLETLQVSWTALVNEAKITNDLYVTENTERGQMVSEGPPIKDRELFPVTYVTEIIMTLLPTGKCRRPSSEVSLDLHTGGIVSTAAMT